jgi:hypothetical protein
LEQSGQLLQEDVKGASPPSVLVLRLGAEGGGVSLIGRQSDVDRWWFAFTLVDQTPTFLVKSDAHREITRSCEWISGWDGALQLMDKRCRYWPDLHPVEVHPLFRDAVLAAVLNRGGPEVRDSWMEDIELKERLAQRRKTRK